MILCGVFQQEVPSGVTLLVLGGCVGLEACGRSEELGAESGPVEE